MDTANVLQQALKHRSLIMGTIVAMVQDIDHAEDLFQETMLIIVQQAETFDNSRKFLPWARGIARNMVYRYWEKSGKQPDRIMRKAIDFAVEAIEADDPQNWEQEKQALRTCLKKLRPKHRQLLNLRYIKNIKGSQLAEQAQMRYASIRTTLMRIRTILRKCITSQLST